MSLEGFGARLRGIARQGKALVIQLGIIRQMQTGVTHSRAMALDWPGFDEELSGM